MTESELIDTLRQLYTAGYEAGHNDTVESCYTDAEEKFDDYHKDGEWDEEIALIKAHYKEEAVEAVEKEKTLLCSVCNTNYVFDKAIKAIRSI